MATRARFKDSVDFIGWYTSKSSKILKISKNDVFKQYVAYHEGWGNYKNYKNNNKIILIAKKVEKQSSKYKKQLLACQYKLNRKNILFFNEVLFLILYQQHLFFLYFLLKINTLLV